jgi:HAD superfamily phosphoserine phosphatase-like hydrolase
MENSKEEVYIFDVCGTLYHVNTTYDFLLFYFREKDWKKYWTIKLLLSFPSKVLIVLFTKMGLKLDIRPHLVAFLKGEKVEDVEVYSKRFVTEYLNSKRVLKTQYFLKAAQEKQKTVILVSASLEPVIKAIADNLQVKEYYASQLEKSNNGHYSGNLANDLRGEKLPIFTGNFDLRNLGLVVHTDNLDDIALIEAAEKTFIISKKRNLKRWEKLLASHKDAEIIHV